MDMGMSRQEAERQASAPPTPRPSPAASPAARPLEIDLAKIDFPVMAVNGEFDRPIAKTHRLWRELKEFTNVVLPGKSHLTAIAAPYMPKEYLESVVRFVDAHDPKP
jgi:pimeloyl-ACP methyl ester carboxylesterase